ncbi:MAG TPA: hypothetical protein VGP33_13305 [Chloroflexota bacterium]|nr:hypothetical protein [Chloroflexota bacterium]
MNAAADLDGILAGVLREATALVAAPAGQFALVDLDRRFFRGRVGLKLAADVGVATPRRIYAQPDPNEDIYALAMRTCRQ